MARAILPLIALLGASLVPTGTSAAPPASRGGGGGGGQATFGDFDGDGKGDLAIGVAREDVGGQSEAGAVNVLYSGSGGLTAAGDQFWSQGSPGVLESPGPNDHFGNALASADFDRDGYADLAIGARNDDVGGDDVSGVVHVLYGRAGGLGAGGDQLWHQDRPGIVDEAESFEEFGHALAAGNFDGDGYPDLAVGVNREDVGAVDTGAVHILYGSAGGLVADGNQLFDQGSAGVPDDPEANDHWGSILAVGDFGQGSQSDLAVSSRFEEIAGVTRAGAVNVLYGSPAGLTGSGSQLWHQDSPGVLDQVEEDDDFGTSLAARDFGSGPQADLAIGAWTEEVGGVSGAGAVNVLYGSPAGLTATGNQFWHQDSPQVRGQAQPSDVLGLCLAARNFGKTPHADLAIAVIGEDVGGADGAGAVNVLYGSSSGLTAAGNEVWHQDRGGIADSAEADDSLGLCLSSGNLGRGPEGDLVIGVTYEDVGGADGAGAAHVLFGADNGLRATGSQLWHQATPGVKDSPADFEEFGRGFS